MPHRHVPTAVLAAVLAARLAAGEQPSAAALPTAAVAGFAVTRVAEATKDQGSWICLAEDDQGRLIVSAQKGPLWRLTLADAGATAQKLESPLSDCMGLLWVDGALYANGSGPQGYAVYRLRDADGDGTFEEVKPVLEVAKKSVGGGEHGVHAVLLGPDRKLYVMNGNHTALPAGLAATSPHRNYAEDFLLPRQWDANGHAKGILAPGGYVVRVGLDGKDPELVCAGFRNAYDFAFSATGELFTYDSDMEWEVGLPWYKPTRILHCTSGAEFGWRSGSGKWPATHIDSLGAVIDMGLGSPTGTCFGTGARFPERYQRALFACDWAYGTIHAVHLAADGAGWTGTAEPFVTGKPLNVCDLVVARDGALYFVTGGRGTGSSLFKVAYTGGEPTAPAAVPPVSEAVALRRRLEALHGAPDPAALDAAWPHLDSADRALRYAARIAVERQPVASWQARALAETRPRAALAALAALARYGDKATQKDLLARLAALDWTALDRQGRLDAARVHALAFIRMGKPADASALGTRLAALMPSGDVAVDGQLLELLVFLGAPEAPRRGLVMAAAAGDLGSALAPVFALRSATAGWTDDLRAAYLGWFNDFEVASGGRPATAGSKWGPGSLGHSMGKQLALMRSDALAAIPAEEKARLPKALLAEKPPVFKIPPPPRAGAKPVQKWTVADLEGDLGGAAAGRSFASGRGWFNHLCAQCHRIGGSGGGTGPDLTGAGKRFSRRDLVEAIVDPQKVVSDQYQHVMRMPPGLLDRLQRAEILDLIAFIENAGDEKAAAFVAGAGAAPRP